MTKSYDQDYAIDKVVSSSSSGLIVDATVDVLGNLINASSTAGANPPTQQYQYDPLYRLTNVQNGSGTSLEAFNYNLTGDRLSKTLSGQTAQPYTYAPSTHRLASVAGVARSYDADGNTTATSSGLPTFAFDDRNRYAAVNISNTCQDKKCTVVAEKYNYNGRGERVFKENDSTVSGVVTATQTGYVYSESGQLLGEYRAGAGSAPQREYIYLDGTPIAYATGGVLYYIETDQLGTPRQVIQPGTPDTTVWKWDYFANNSAFGENTPSVQTITFNLRFPGQYFDSETGLNYNYFRDYEAGTGRYVESDPIGLGGGMATYAYSTSSPLMFTDWSGLSPDCCMRAYQANLFGAYPMGKAPAGGLTVCCDGKLMGCANPFLPNQSTSDQIIIRCIKRHEDEHADYQAQPCSDCGVSAPPPTPWIGKPLAECSAAHIEVSCLINSENECRKEGRSSGACLKAIRDRIGSVRGYGDSNMVGCFSR